MIRVLCYTLLISLPDEVTCISDLANKLPFLFLLYCLDLIIFSVIILKNALFILIPKFILKLLFLSLLDFLVDVRVEALQTHEFLLKISSHEELRTDVSVIPGATGSALYRASYLFTSGACMLSFKD